MHYILVQFTKGLNVAAYQEVDDGGIVARYCNLSGDTLDIPDVTESYVVDANPARPGWGL